MNKKNIIKQERKEKKTELINMRITLSLRKWLKEKKYSPTGIFMEGVKDLGYKGDEK